MKGLYIVITASVLVASLPLAGAETFACYREPPQEGLVHPLLAGRYLFVDVTQPEKLGEWTERNQRPGLQTEDCGSPQVYYQKDQQALVLP